jgi:uncharacterized damage-inducible protein DinB
MSNTIEFCIARRKAERPAFLKVLKAIPQGKGGYRPEPKARTAAELAWVVVSEEGDLVKLLETGDIDWKETPPPATMEEMVATYERDAARVDERLAQIDEAAWKKPGRFLVGGNAVWQDEVGNMVWGFLFDAIHHRGQLSTYLRPMGSKVPSIYGPSADDTGQ